MNKVVSGSENSLLNFVAVSKARSAVDSSGFDVSEQVTSVDCGAISERQSIEIWASDGGCKNWYGGCWLFGQNLLENVVLVNSLMPVEATYAGINTAHLGIRFYKPIFTAFLFGSRTWLVSLPV